MFSIKFHSKLKELNLSPKNASEIPLDKKNELPFAN
jgi:hypothetical protein